MLVLFHDNRAHDNPSLAMRYWDSFLTNTCVKSSNAWLIRAIVNWHD